MEIEYYNDAVTILKDHFLNINNDACRKLIEYHDIKLNDYIKIYGSPDKWFTYHRGDTMGTYFKETTFVYGKEKIFITTLLP